MQFALLTCATALLTFVTASPLEQRQSQCHPNFEGVGVSVVWNQPSFEIREWVPVNPGENITTIIDDFNSAAEFRFEQTGSPATTYLAKKLNVPANNQVVSVGSNNQFLDIALLGSNDPNQSWEVTCGFCGSDATSTHGLFADGCTIKSTNLGMCTQVVTMSAHANSAPSFLLQMATCNGASSQEFQFWMV